MQFFKKTVSDLCCVQCGLLSNSLEMFYFECGHFVCRSCRLSHKRCLRCNQVSTAQLLSDNARLNSAYSITLDIFKHLGIKTDMTSIGVNNALPNTTLNASDEANCVESETCDKITENADKKLTGSRSPTVQLSAEIRHYQEPKELLAINMTEKFNDNNDDEKTKCVQSEMDDAINQNVKSSRTRTFKLSAVMKSSHKSEEILADNTPELSTIDVNETRCGESELMQQNSEGAISRSRRVKLKTKMQPIQEFKEISAVNTHKELSNNIDKSTIVESEPDKIMQHNVEGELATSRSRRVKLQPSQESKEMPAVNMNKETNNVDELKSLESDVDRIIHQHVESGLATARSRRVKISAMVKPTQEFKKISAVDVPKELIDEIGKTNGIGDAIHPSIGGDLTATKPRRVEVTAMMKPIQELSAVNLLKDVSNAVEEKNYEESKKGDTVHHYAGLRKSQRSSVTKMSKSSETLEEATPVLPKRQIKKRKFTSAKTRAADATIQNYDEPSTTPNVSSNITDTLDMFEKLWSLFESAGNASYCYYDSNSDTPKTRNKRRSLGRITSQRINSKGETKLHRAAHQRNLSQVVDLLKGGEDPNIADYAGWTPLHDAIAKVKDLSLVSVLLEHGANPDAHGLDNQTPLHLAVEANNYEIIQKLLDFGADPSSSDIHGISPRDLAANDAKALALLSCDTKSRKLLTPIRLISQPPIVVYYYDIPDTQFAIVKKFTKHFLLEETRDIIQATHVIVSPSVSSSQFNWTLTQVMAKASYLCSISWCEDSLRAEKLFDAKSYHVDISWMPGWARARDNANRCGPGLFSGCHIMLNCANVKTHKLYGESVDLAQLRNFIKVAGGQLLTRMPDPESPYNPVTVPYHGVGNMSKCSQIVLYIPRANDSSIKYNMTHLKCLPMQWLIDCILQFQISPFDPHSGDVDK